MYQNPHLRNTPNVYKYSNLMHTLIVYQYPQRKAHTKRVSLPREGHTLNVYKYPLKSTH